MRLSYVVNLFKEGNVMVCGPKGKGKDVLFGNVIARRRKPYVSNLDYTQDDLYQKLDFSKIDCGGNTYRELISGKVKYYKFPYEPESDIYISDAGIYLPAQYCNELNRDFKHMPTYFAVCRQLSHNAVHANVQAFPRVWDKLREQSADTYIRCRFCKVLFGFLVVQKITVYDKYQSAVDRVTPCRITVPLLANKEVKQNAQIYLDKFRNTYGMVRNGLLIYINKSKHDTYYFEKLFLQGEKNENQQNKTN